MVLAEKMMRCFLLLAIAVALLSGATASADRFARIVGDSQLVADRVHGDRSTVRVPAAAAYTPLCGGANPACVYAYSTERKMVAGATTGIAVYRSVDGMTQSIGFTRNGRTDTAAVQAFCNAAVSGVISRNCFLSTLYDQAYEAVHRRTGGCDITNATPSAMPTYLTWPAHSNLPQFQKGGPGTGTNFYLDATGCTALTGGAQSLFYSGSNLYWGVRQADRLDSMRILQLPSLLDRCSRPMLGSGLNTMLAWLEGIAAVLTPKARDHRALSLRPRTAI